jgi:DNA polymerase-4
MFAGWTSPRPPLRYTPGVVDKAPPKARLCCLDLDTFFVSVERLLDPSLVGKPVVVGGTRQRGVVTAASYEVRALGVHSGMPTAEAVRLAPNAIFLPTRHGVYSPYSARVRKILERYSPEVHTASIDEFFLDFAGCETLYAEPQDGDPDATIERVVWQMRDSVHSELGLPSSAGIGATRAVAKIASGLAKPAGVVLVRVGDEERRFASLPVRKVPGIGPVTESRLVAAGIETVGELLGLRPGPLHARFARTADSVRRALDPSTGSRLGRDRPAFLELGSQHETMGSISNERTFSADIGDREALDRQLLALCERVCWRARKRETRARTVTLKLRYADFKTLTRARTLAQPTNEEQRVFATVRGLLKRAWTRKAPIRLVGVALSSLSGPSLQLALFGGESQPRSIGPAIDVVRARFGYDAIRLGATGKTRWLEQRPAAPGSRARKGHELPPDDPALE